MAKFNNDRVRKIGEGLVLAAKQSAIETKRIKNGKLELLQQLANILGMYDQVVPSCDVGLFTMISIIPSGTSVNVAFHAKELVPAPDTRAGSGFATVPQFTFVIDGVPPFPELDTLNEIEFVIESQLIGTLNSRLMSTVVAFVSPDSA